jgi:outer membrane murein-binding lipoprotein Lpp
LKRLRLVEEQYGEQVLERKVSELAKQVSELKGQVAKLTGTPKKRSPKKKAAS